MISEKTEYILEVALANAKIADEISARLIDVAPASEAEAQAILDVLDKSMNKKIEEYLIVAMANKSAGKELANKINGLIAVLEAKANGASSPAVVASFTGQVAGMTTDVTIDADVAGSAGNVTLVADSISDIDALIAAHNGAADPEEQVTLSDGDGSQIPTADITLADGEDSSDVDLAVAQAALGQTMINRSVSEILVVAMANRSAAMELRDAIETMVSVAKSIA